MGRLLIGIYLIGGCVTARDTRPYSQPFSRLDGFGRFGRRLEERPDLRLGLGAHAPEALLPSMNGLHRDTNTPSQRLLSNPQLMALASECCRLHHVGVY